MGARRRLCRAIRFHRRVSRRPAEVTNRNLPVSSRRGLHARGVLEAPVPRRHPDALVSRGDGALQGPDRTAGPATWSSAPIRMVRRNFRSTASAGTRPRLTQHSWARSFRRCTTVPADTAGRHSAAAGPGLSGTNHEGSGPRRADASRLMSAYGAIDMAGNVREWSASASDGSTRIALGGAWSDPAYHTCSPTSGLRSIARRGTACAA